MCEWPNTRRISGHFLLTNLLIDMLKASATSRVVTVSSTVYAAATMNWDDLMFEKEGSYSQTAAYPQSKLANILFSSELARRLQGTSVGVWMVVGMYTCVRVWVCTCVRVCAVVWVCTCLRCGWIVPSGWLAQGSHSTWKTWKNEGTPGKPGNIMEFWKF